MAFFEASAVKDTKPLPLLLPRCGACGLFSACTSPKMSVKGRGDKGILFVTDVPDDIDDHVNAWMQAASGRYLRTILDRQNIDFDRDCWTTGALICHTPDNRNPTADEVEHCRPNLVRTIRDLKPRVIIPFGSYAVKSLLGHLWGTDVGSINEWVGWHIPLQEGNVWVAPVFHPGSVLDTEKESNGKAVKVIFERHLASAVQLQGRPWETVPDWSKLVKVLIDPTEAARTIRWIIAQGGACAFDYETTRLKPEGPGARIVCASICWRGQMTIAFPMVGEAVVAMKEFLVSSLPKIGANTKFETRWSRTILDTDPIRWVWDTMLSAHHQDNRRYITGVGFQAFVLLGFKPWYHHIEPYLTSSDAVGLNRIDQVDLPALLLYCGLDSLVEYFIAIKQRAKLDTV